MDVHLIDGTFELFRWHYARRPGGEPPDPVYGATRGLLHSLARLLTVHGATHVAVAFDTVIESFRNDIFPGYKTSAGMDPALLAQFPLAERAVRALGVTVWSMIEFEADDAIATAALKYLPEVDRVILGSPDKDLCQCVIGERVVAFDSIRKRWIDEAAVREKFGVGPASIPDWLGLVGDAADGLPGVPRWGAKSTAAILARYGHIEAIPTSAAAWDVPIRGADSLSASLEANRAAALLYRDLATLRRDVDLPESLADLEWRGAHRGALSAICEEIGDPEVLRFVNRWRDD
jgi:5'-3' exonuclease